MKSAYMHVHRRRNQGALPPPPPQISNICFHPPPPKLTNIGWKSLLSMYYRFSSVTFMSFFARGFCIHNYMEIKELIHNPKLPNLFSPPPPPPPPQVVTCSSAFDVYQYGEACRVHTWPLGKYLSNRPVE